MYAFVAVDLEGKVFEWRGYSQGYLNHLWEKYSKKENIRITFSSAPD